MAVWWEVGLFVGFVAAGVLRRMLRSSRLCPSQKGMAGKTVIITGANSGLGRATALELARRNARIILACRSMSSASQAAKYVTSNTGNTEMVPRELDLSSLNSIRKFSEQILEEENQIDVLVNNAGVFQCPYTKTEDGFEMQMGVNHLGHFLLTSLLIERIKQSAPSRIVVVSSALSKRGSIKFENMHSEEGYDKMRAYADSKLANLMFTQKLSEKLEGSRVTVLAMHPGMVATNLGRHVVSKPAAFFLSPLAVALGLRDAHEGCQSIIFCCVADELRGMSGAYVNKLCQITDYPDSAKNEQSIQQLWDLSEKQTKTKFL